ncbi:hypothetical protein [Haloglomus halophilum]|uniref:hypothetical protein n=1 Tax=Haloglomus halophilum TaxID=2962672 RepID=UPI0020C9FE73|nr:hypothetical protein [Haloglomus halophilum]
MSDGIGHRLRNLGLLFIDVAFVALCAAVVLFKPDGWEISDVTWWQWSVASILFVGLTIRSIQKFRNRAE